MLWNPPDFERLNQMKEDLFLRKKGSQTGWLYEALHLIVSKETAQSVIAYYDDEIKKELSIYEEQCFLEMVIKFNRLLQNESKETGFLNFLTNLVSSERDKFLKAYAERVLLAAFLLVGCYLLVLLQPSGEKKDDDALTGNKGNKGEQVKQKAVLVLIVPSRHLDVGELGETPTEISFDLAVKLIDSAIYYRCTDVKQANDRENPKQENSLDLKDEIPSNREEQDIYMRLEIEGGSDLIGEKTKLKIKRNLSQHRTFLTRISLLVRATGLDDLIRV